ncbi:MAG: hypothetical protein AAF598_08425 [Bacteroidota bacterium]
MDDPRPDWLKNLAIESWQPEMVISGAIIVASTYIPGLVIEGYVLLAITGNRFMQIMVTLVQIYLLIGAFSITINFIAHFTLRTLWVGLVGLVSVFPNGINPDNLKFSERFKARLLEEFGSIDDYILKLDQLCSVIFAFASNVVLVFLSISWAIAWSFLIFYLLTFFFPDDWLLGEEYLAYLGVLLLIIAPSLLSAILSNKYFHNKEWANRIHFPFYRAYGKVVFSIFWKPINFIQYIFSSNIKQERFVLLIVVYMMAIGFCSSIYLNFQGEYNSISKRVPVGNIDEQYLKPNHYWNMVDQDRYVILPYIEKDRFAVHETITGFIPLYRREENAFERLFGPFEFPEEIARVERFILQRTYLIKCAEQFYTFKINDSIVQPEILYHRHPRRFEKGFSFRIPSKNLPEGKQILSIKKKRILPKKDKDQKEYATIIPFWIEE